MVQKLIYLDYQATTPVAPEVVEVMLPYFTEDFIYPSLTNSLGRKINLAVEKSREVVAQSLNCNPNELFFTSGATESINTAIKGLFECEQNGNIVTTKIEHSAVLSTCRHLSRRGITTTYMDVEGNGLIDLQKLSDSITADTKLVAVMEVNNEIGVIQPIKEIGEICLKKNVPLFVDAAQSYGKMNIDVQQSNISMLAASGHKIYAPKGVGILYVNKKIKSKLLPLLHGGGQENGFRAGTLNIPNIIGLSKAVEIATAEMQSEQKRILTLRNLLLKLLEEKLTDIAIIGDMKNRIAGNLNISFKDVSGDILFNHLENVIISKGSACNSMKNQSSHVLKAMGIPSNLIDSAIRISIGRYTTESEIVMAAERISKTVNKIREISKLN